MSTSNALHSQLPRNYFNAYSRPELDGLFEQLETPVPDELSGTYQGQLFSIIGTTFLPLFIKQLIYWLIGTFINPWKGKRFDGKMGANTWLNQRGNITYGIYEINYPEDTTAPLLLNYDVNENLGVMRPIRGEVKRLSSNVYLARMLYKTKNKTHSVLYFTLQKTEK